MKFFGCDADNGANWIRMSDRGVRMQAVKASNYMNHRKLSSTSMV